MTVTCFDEDPKNFPAVVIRWIFATNLVAKTISSAAAATPSTKAIAHLTLRPRKARPSALKSWSLVKAGASMVPGKRGPGLGLMMLDCGPGR